jgi:hypothetical protein
MPDDLSVAVERLRTSTQRLNTLADAAGQLIKSVEDFLEESHVGVTASVNLGYIPDPDDEETPESITRLAYRRVKSGKFRIALVEVSRYSQSDDDHVVRPWAECSRDEKIDGLRKLPELLVELANRVNEKTDQAERAMAAISSLLPAVTKRKGGE